MKLILALATLLILDGLFLSVQRSTFNRIYTKIQHAPIKLRVFSAIACYVFLSFLLYYFIFIPKKTVLDAFLLGVGVYGVYETTTYAVLHHYPLYMVLLDTLWGGILFACATAVYRWA